MSGETPQRATRRTASGGVWIEGSESQRLESAPEFNFEVLDSEEAVGHEMLAELDALGRRKDADFVIVLLGGRGAQAFHRLLGLLAQTQSADRLLERLHVFTQDALSPLGMSNPFSFVRDFERLLGPAFFKKIRSFTPIRSDTDDPERELLRYVDKLESLGGIDLFFVGLGPEPGGASHIAYVKPGSGARIDDVAGLIPISNSILEHHISKFKAGGCVSSPEDEQECRRATHILTLGPAAILGARRVVQSVVDARTAPGKRESFKRLLETELSNEPGIRALQFDQNPGLWLRLHPNLRSLILPDALEV